MVSDRTTCPVPTGSVSRELTETPVTDPGEEPTVPQCERLNELLMTGRVLPSVYKEFGQTQDGKSR